MKIERSNELSEMSSRNRPGSKLLKNFGVLRMTETNDVSGWRLYLNYA